jgi:demethylmenaquinone methyltransferase/2-methoxy-6-polyprenyl-1,4-benzoquinol methylase
MPVDRKTYRWFYDHIHSRYYNLLVKWCFLPAGGEARCRETLLAPVEFARDERILDMCCGTGGATRVISEKAGKGCWIAGMDLSAGQIGVAGRRPGRADTRFLVGDAAHAPFRDRCFDRVFIPHALHEMPRESRLRVLAEARRILDDGGTLIILELDTPPSLFVRLFAGLWAFYWLPFNFETPTRKDMLKHGLTNEVTEAGFKQVTKTSAYHGAFQTVQGVK